MYALDPENQTRRMQRDELGMPIYDISLQATGADLHDHISEVMDAFNRVYDETLECWASTLDIREGREPDYTVRLADKCVRLAILLGTETQKCMNIRRGVLLHNVGKMCITENTLQKCSRLTKDEQAFLTNHPADAFKLLSPIKFLAPALDIPRYQCENWDGSGAPFRLKGETIPIAARIFAAVDSWESLKSEEAKKTRPMNETLVKRYKEQEGVKLDPRVAAVFYKMIADEEPEFAAHIALPAARSKSTQKFWQQTTQIQNPFIPA